MLKVGMTEGGGHSFFVSVSELPWYSVFYISHFAYGFCIL